MSGTASTGDLLSQLGGLLGQQQPAGTTPLGTSSLPAGGAGGLLGGALTAAQVPALVKAQMNPGAGQTTQDQMWQAMMPAGVTPTAFQRMLSGGASPQQAMQGFQQYGNILDQLNMQGDQRQAAMDWLSQQPRAQGPLQTQGPQNADGRG